VAIGKGITILTYVLHRLTHPQLWKVFLPFIKVTRKTNILTGILGFSILPRFNNSNARSRSPDIVSQRCHVPLVTIAVPHIPWEEDRLIIIVTVCAALHPVDQSADSSCCSDLSQFEMILEMPHERLNLGLVIVNGIVILLTDTGVRWQHPHHICCLPDCGSHHPPCPQRRPR